MEYLTTGQAAKLLGVSARTIQRICDSGELRSERVTKSSPRRIKRDELQKYIEKRDLDIQLQVG